MRMAPPFRAASLFFGGAMSNLPYESDPDILGSLDQRVYAVKDLIADHDSVLRECDGIRLAVDRYDRFVDAAATFLAAMDAAERIRSLSLQERLALDRLRHLVEDEILTTPK